MTDERELLERCAKVMGLKLYCHAGQTFFRPEMEPMDRWNPLASRDDAAAMAIECKVDVMWAPRNNTVVARCSNAEIGYATSTKDHPTEQAAYCYAICQVVAQMGGE